MSNVFSPQIQEAAKNKKITDVVEYTELMAIGDLYLQEKEYSKALLYYNRAITLFPEKGDARISASRVVYIRDQIPIFEALSGIIASGLDYQIIIDILNSNSVYSSNGGLNQIYSYLNAPGGYSVIKNELVTTEGTNSLVANINMVIVTALLLPSKLFDSSGNQIHNEFGPGGDSILYSNANLVLPLSFDDFISNLGGITNMDFDTNGLSPSNLAPIVTQFSNIDQSIKTIHDALETNAYQFINLNNAISNLLDMYETFNFCINNISQSDQTGLITNEVNSITDTIETTMTILDGDIINIFHSNLNGDYAFALGDTITSFVPSAWPDFFNDTIVTPTSNNIQGLIKIKYTNIMYITNYTNNPFNFLNYLTNLNYNIDIDYVLSNSMQSLSELFPQ